MGRAMPRYGFARYRCVALFTAATLVHATAALPAVTDTEQAPREVQSLLAELGPGFQLRQTPHFVVLYDTDEDVLKPFISRIEATYQCIIRFLEVNDIPYSEPQQRLVICFFAQYDRFVSFASAEGHEAEHIAGYYDISRNRAVFYDAATMPRLRSVQKRIDQLEEEVRAAHKRHDRSAQSLLSNELFRLRNRRDNITESVNRLVIQHEVAHQVFFNTGVLVRGADNPPWLVEGLACLFEMPPSSQSAGIPGVNAYRLLNLRQAMAGSPKAAAVRKVTSAAFAPAVVAGRLVSLAELVSRKPLIDGGTPPAENLYAQSWSLVFYLQRKHREDLAVYMTVIAKRPADRAYSPAQERQLFEATFGTLDQRFTDEWLRFVLDLPVRVPQG